MAAVETRTTSEARPVAPGPPDVSVHDVHKTFALPHRHVHTLKERVLHPFQSRTADTLHALRGVSFEVGRGEFFGVVGRNGSGKSTLLKCLAGIYDVDRGDVRVRGRLSPFIELGVGFNTELAARDNVTINGVMLGLSRAEARARFDDVIAFAELEPFTELKLKNYSSGMVVRLAFATAIQVDADVLLVDEVLAVGDASFQRKCFEEFERLKARGKTIIFVTHDMSAVERFCDRALLLHHGELVELGDPGLIARRYHELNFGRLDEEDHETRGAAEITAAWFEDARGERAVAITSGDRCALVFDVEIKRPLEDPVFSMGLRTEAGAFAWTTSSLWEWGDSGSFTPGERVRIRAELPLWLAPGRYTLAAYVARAVEGAGPIDGRDGVAAVVVTGPRGAGGVAALPHELTLERR